jgi:hypothetical protein
MPQENAGTRLIPVQVYEYIMSSPEEQARWPFPPGYHVDYSDLTPDNMEISVPNHPLPHDWIRIKCTRSPFLDLANGKNYDAVFPEDKIVDLKWDRFDIWDPNYEENRDRVAEGLPPIDYWNVGVRYHY